MIDEDVREPIRRTRRRWWWGALACAAILPTSAIAQPPPEAAQVLQKIKAADKEQLAISDEDGRFLRVLIAANGAKRVLEIGGASGYSAIWMGLALRTTGGRLTTIEFDPVRARSAAENIRAAGLADVVTVVHGDAFAEIPKLHGTFDLVFCDAWKRDYKRYLDLVLPRLNLRGLFLAHNVLNKQAEMRDFLDAINNEPRLFTSIVAPSGEGISISVKIR